MIDSHFPRSTAKDVDLRAFTRSTAAAFSMTQPVEGEADQPFCGAEIRTSTPVAFMSTQTQPEAIQSSTNNPPTA